MININDKSKCMGCGVCAAVCPRNCIRMRENSAGFYYPEVDNDKCINCSLCEKKCPVLNPASNRPNEPEDVYAMKNRDEAIREQSSSGGVFSLLAKQTLEQGGTVYGAAFDSNFLLRHVAAECEEDLAAVRRTKIIQSRTDMVFRDVRQKLESGKNVLFSGTPCQIQGLMQFLGKEYDNLLTHDLICHGVLSPLVFNKYLSYRESLSGSKAVSVSFRNKEYGWDDYAVRIEFSNGTYYLKSHRKDEITRVYLRNYALRPICYNCPFKGRNRMSDITLADMWGIKKIISQFDDDKGVSLVIANTEKGKTAIDKLFSDSIYQKVDYDISVKFNQSMNKCPPQPADNDNFLSDITHDSFETIIARYCKLTAVQKTKLMVKNVLKKIICENMEV